MIRLVKSDNVIDQQVAFGAFVYEDGLEGCIDLRIYLNHQEYIFKAIEDKLFGEYGNEFSYEGTLDFNGKTFWFYVSSYHRGDYLALFDSPKDSYKDVFEWFLKHKPEDKHPDSVVNISLDREINDPIYIDNKLFTT